MRKAIFITVRTDSSRLPDKALLPILNKPTIEMVILRAKQARGFDKVILCTTERQIDDQIVEIARKCGIDYFRGSLEDKLERWLGATQEFNIDFFVTMDGDDLLCDPYLLEVGAKQMEKGDYDFIKAPDGLATGAFTYAIRTSALKKVCQIKDTSETEMMWVYFEDTGLFKVGELLVDDEMFMDFNIRLTLDYPEDLAFFTRVFEEFNNINNDVPLKNIMSFLKEHPEISQINFSRQQDWLENQKKKTKLIIKG